MKKLFILLTTLFVNLCVFASIYEVPSDAVLADYYNAGEVCMCFYVPADIACNDIVVTGSFNGWSSNLSACVSAEPVVGYDGWYVASFEPEDEPDAEKGMQAKPIMLDVDGNFNWDNQVGAATAIRGGVQVVQSGYAGEVDLINYGADAPNVFTIEAWKKDPCAAVYHNYTVTVINDGCNGLTIPFIVGGMTGWEFKQMQLDMAKTLEYQAAVYYYSFKAAEGTPYQIVSAGMDPQTGLVDTLAPAGWKDEAYMQKLVDEMWVRIPGEDRDNQLTHEDANIVWDLRTDSLRWARCYETAEYVVFCVNFPTRNRPDSIEIIGAFDDWTGTQMELLETGWHLALFYAKPSQYFKFRSAGSWDTELEVYDSENDEWSVIQDNQLVFGQLWQDDIYKGTPCKYIELDLSDPAKYRWKGGISTLSLTCDPTEGIVTGFGEYDKGSEVTINAYPYDGYHFVQWSDGNTENPRTIVMTQDISLTAEFASHPLPHMEYDTIQGRAWYRAWYDSIPEYKNNYELYDIFAEPNYGYHFDHWSDGTTQAWRTVRITSDTVFTAFFAPDLFEIKTRPDDPLYGTTYGDTIVPYGETIEIKAVPNYGYYFAYWDLGTDKPDWEDTTSIQPTYIVVKENRTCTAYFHPKFFFVACDSEDQNKGRAVVNNYNWHKYLDTVTIEAIPNYGYHFTQWADGSTRNPRKFTITKDTAFVAQFAIDRSGFCGKDDVLRWEYDTVGRTLTISGNGALQENYTYGVEAPQTMEKLVIAEGVTAIGNNAFDGFATIAHISLPSTVKTIYEQAFYNCTGLQEIYCYRDRPCVAYSNTFDGIDKFDCTLHVLSSAIDMYRSATGWRDFYYIESIDAQTVVEPITEVETVPSDNTVEITWPMSEGAEKYTIVITKDGVVFCSLIFSADGQLLGIAFAPGRNGQSNAPAAVMTANGGLRFTVTGLDSGTEYQMTVVATNAADEEVANYTSEFTTTANADAITALDNTSSDLQSASKLLRDGQIFILRGDKTYTLTGQEVK